MDKNKSIGILILGIIFILIGVIFFQQDRTPIENSGITSSTIRAMHAELDNVERDLQYYKQDPSAMYQTLRNLSKITKAERTWHRTANPIIMIINAYWNKLICALFIFCGVLLVRRNRLGRKLAFWIVGMTWLSLAIHMGSVTYNTYIHFPILKRISYLSGEIHGQIPSLKNSFWDTFSFWPLVVEAGLIKNILFTIIIIYFFTRPSVKEQFA